jgi:predicted Na+-dependent transporter
MLLAPRPLFVLVPHTGLVYEPRTIALGVVVLSASLRCRPEQLANVFRSSGVTALLAVYVAVPLVALAMVGGLLRSGSVELRAVAIGLGLLTVIPVAMTSSVWTSASRGNVALSLGTLALTSALAVLVIPFAIAHVPHAHDVALAAPIAVVRSQVILAFAVPLVLGMTLRALASRVADALEPAMSVLSFGALLLSVADCAGVLRPQLTAHSAVLALAVGITISANALAFAAGYFAARVRGLPYEDAITVVFASGMRSTPAAMIVGAIAFPTMPLATLVPVLWSVTQQLFAAFLTRRFLDARDRQEPVLPLSVRYRRSMPRMPSRMPSLVDLEESIVLPLVRTFRDTLVDTPYEELFETLVYRPQTERKRSELSNVIARRELS